MSLSIHSYDVIMLAVLVGATLLGAWKGMAWQLASLASVLVSVAAAFYFGASLAPYFGSAAPWNRFIAMLVLYLATSMAIWLLFRLVSGLIDRVQLKEFDRQLGAIFGFLKGALLCVLITFFAVMLSERARQAVLKSHSGRVIARLIEHADPVIPQDARTVLGKYIDEFDRQLDPESEPSDEYRLEELERSGRKIQGELQEAGQRLEGIRSKIEERFGSEEPPRGRGGENDSASDEDAQTVEIGHAEDHSPLVR